MSISIPLLAAISVTYTALVTVAVIINTALSAIVTVAWSVSLSVCPSVTLVHSAKAVGRNEMLFHRVTRSLPNQRLRPLYGKVKLRVRNFVNGKNSHCRL